MKRLRDALSPASKLKYLMWRASRNKNALRVKLRGGPSVFVRPEPATDLCTAWEIFVGNAYRPPKELPKFKATSIVDVGANVGLSLGHWLSQFPDAQFLAFEPHPVHVEMLRRVGEANDLGARLRIVDAAAGTRNSEAYITSDENKSHVVDTAITGAVHVAVRDFFEEVAAYSGIVDLLKIDIEGGEYPIFADARFKDLNVLRVVYEWHNTPDYPNGRDWCINRFSELGYAVKPGEFEFQGMGIGWAWKE